MDVGKSINIYQKYHIPIHTTHLHQNISEHLTGSCPELHDGFPPKKKNSTNVYCTSQSDSIPPQIVTQENPHYPHSPTKSRD